MNENGYCPNCNLDFDDGLIYETFLEKYQTKRKHLMPQKHMVRQRPLVSGARELVSTVWKKIEQHTGDVQSVVMNGVEHE